ncbi:exo-alpha-sialidase [Bacteroides xylanisolvens]|nr:exo-alpha-sialidase [Bacteroides xylanisolvens]
MGVSSVLPSTEGSNGWRVHFEISDDKGKTWKMVGPLWMPSYLSPPKIVKREV